MASINLGRVVGDSAYEVAVSQGYTGTESEWLASLQGQEGFSPIATVARTASDDGAIITITDNTGTTSAIVYDGAATASVSWDNVNSKPFDFIGDGLEVDQDSVLMATWSTLDSRPFDYIDDVTLGLDPSSKDNVLSVVPDGIYGMISDRFNMALTPASENVDSDETIIDYPTAEYTVMYDVDTSFPLSVIGLGSGDVELSEFVINTTDWNNDEYNGTYLDEPWSVVIGGNDETVVTLPVTGWQSLGVTSFKLHQLYQYSVKTPLDAGYIPIDNNTITVSNGVLVSPISESDPVFSASPAATITASDISAWNAKQDAMTITGSGDVTVTVSDNNYVVSASIPTFTESDPIFGASPAASITATDISNWNAIVGVPSASTVTDGYVLTTSSGAAAWAAPVAGGGTRVIDVRLLYGDISITNQDDRDYLSLAYQNKFTDYPFVLRIVGEDSNQMVSLYQPHSRKQNAIYAINLSNYKQNSSKSFSVTGALSPSIIMISFYNNVYQGVAFQSAEIGEVVATYTASWAPSGNAGQTLAKELKYIHDNMPNVPTPTSTDGYVLTTSSGSAVWAAPVAPAVTISGGAGIAVDSRDNTISIADVRSEYIETDDFKDEYEYMAPVTGEGIDLIKDHYGWTDTGEVDGNEDPIYDWHYEDRSDIHLSATDGLEVSYTGQPDSDEEELHSAGYYASGIAFSHDWREEDPEDRENKIERNDFFEWSPNSIQLKDQSSGDIYELTINNGQIVLINISL